MHAVLRKVRYFTEIDRASYVDYSRHRWKALDWPFFLHADQFVTSISVLLFYFYADGAE